MFGSVLASLLWPCECLNCLERYLQKNPVLPVYVGLIFLFCCKLLKTHLFHQMQMPNQSLKSQPFCYLHYSKSQATFFWSELIKKTNKNKVKFITSWWEFGCLYIWLFQYRSGKGFCSSPNPDDSIELKSLTLSPGFLHFFLLGLTFWANVG